MNYNEVTGDLIKMAKAGDFDVIAHGCNCFCTMGAGIAPQMAKAFGADKFQMEGKSYQGDPNKLGCIDFEDKPLLQKGQMVTVVNAYTQYDLGRNHKDKGGKIAPIDYEALTLCMRKMNMYFKDAHIGLPGLIGCGLAGGDPDRVKAIIKNELKDCTVTIVYLPQTVKPTNFLENWE